MKFLKPNHKCAVCGKEYYCCDYCVRKQSWRTLCDTVECYERLVESRKPAKQQIIDLSQNIEEIMNKDIEDVKAKTLDDLSDYKEYLEEYGLDKTIDKVNEDINECRKEI